MRKKGRYNNLAAGRERKEKVNVSCARYADIYGSEGKAPLILLVGTRWGELSASWSRPFSPRGTLFVTHWAGRREGSKASPGNEKQFLGHPFLSSWLFMMKKGEENRDKQSRNKRTKQKHKAILTISLSQTLWSSVESQNVTCHSLPLLSPGLSHSPLSGWPWHGSLRAMARNATHFESKVAVL